MVGSESTVRTAAANCSWDSPDTSYRLRMRTSSNPCTPRFPCKSACICWASMLNPCFFSTNTRVTTVVPPFCFSCFSTGQSRKEQGQKPGKPHPLAKKTASCRYIIVTQGAGLIKRFFKVFCFYGFSADPVEIHCPYRQWTGPRCAEWASTQCCRTPPPTWQCQR